MRMAVKRFTYRHPKIHTALRGLSRPAERLLLGARSEPVSSETFALPRDLEHALVDFVAREKTALEELLGRTVPWGDDEP